MGSVKLLAIVKMQNICNLIGQNSYIFLIFLFAKVKTSMEYETHES